MTQTAAYGTWESIITPDMVAGKSQRLSEPKANEHGLFWLETRPQEKGRNALLHKSNRGDHHVLLPEPWSVQSRVHEYGGGAYTLEDDSIFFVNAQDQQIYRFNWILLSDPIRISQKTETDDIRYADLHYCKRTRQLFAVKEQHHTDQIEPTNSLVCFDLKDPDASEQTPQEICSGADFYSNPRTSYCGQWMSWLEWNHPNMPWDSTQLYLASLDEYGAVQDTLCIAGLRQPQSIFQPQWSPNNDLFWVSDLTDWWNIYAISPKDIQQVQQSRNPSQSSSVDEPEELNQHITQITNLQAEFATPQWVFGMSTYGFLDQSNIFATYTRNGIWHAAKINTQTRTIDAIKTDVNHFSDVCTFRQTGYVIGASPTQPPSLYKLTQLSLTPVFDKTSPTIDSRYISQAQTLNIQGKDHRNIHAFYYAPCNPDFTAPPNTLPPVITICHGGPTGATSSQLNLKIQFWTSRGFAVLDVNYCGSTGFGRQYRQALHRHWGQADVDDICAAAQSLCDQNLANPKQLIIKGSSAGGYSVLAALAFRDTFNAGVSLYGIGDLETLATDTHKFEARYLDSLVGPYPEEKALYHRLSPIHHVDKIACPLLVFQGLKDKVVPPNQAESMVNAVKNCGLPVAYVTYPEEAHGFRQADTIRHMLNAEWEFYQRVLICNETDRTETDSSAFTLDIANI